MRTYDQREASCHVFTFKEGLLSAVAHDLEIAVRRFQITRDGTSLKASFEANSLEVMHAMVHGQPSTSTISARDREKIASNISGDVLDAKRYPEIRFTAMLEGEGTPTEIRGKLELHGRTQEIRVPISEAGGRYVAAVTLHQPDFGITPYSAMLGTLRIKPDVRVRLELPRD